MESLVAHVLTPVVSLSQWDGKRLATSAQAKGRGTREVNQEVHSGGASDLSQGFDRDS